ncbi:hypothetical protein FNU76_14655 [Chitinimonas arctica]|uniref:Uncharacterized protein n=1 Tax=Chitinimonas arctica TaxID=2594795 RepID=A0A516SH69_9NEIS|nr:hypothetical protein [Chitinimonas arctica]QDQ27496.1 hypothetical protein FNU76_14655 [Chitinimonas arctica]
MKRKTSAPSVSKANTSKKPRLATPATTLSDMIGARGRKSVELSAFKPEVKVVKNDSWQSLAQNVIDSRGAVYRHQYRLANDMSQKEDVTLAYKHGDFPIKVKEPAPGEFEIPKNNISTGLIDTKARSYPDMMGTFTKGRKGATDAMRVLRGTHLTKGLIGSSAEKRKAAVELAGEIGVSEYARGSTVALTGASTALYMLKHDAIDTDQFSDPDVGYFGAGKGGAKRIRGFNNAVEVFDHYDKSLKKIYNSHASKKNVRPWESGLDLSGQNAAQRKLTTYNAWKAHKFAKWTGREE